MKKLLLLGGCKKSLPLIRYAKSQGHTVVLCDRDSHALCRPFCDHFIAVSTVDYASIVEAVRYQSIDGVVAFGSDVNAVSAAHIAAEKGFPGNPPQSVEAMVRKDLFRKFLASNGFDVPQSYTFTVIEDVIRWREGFQLPLIVKPADAAGSAGVSRIDSWTDLSTAFTLAKQASRQGRVVIETFIERSHLHVIGGDIFVLDGHVHFWGLLNSHRACQHAPFLPTGTSYPLALDFHQQQVVRDTLQRLVSALDIRLGGLNVELMFDQYGRLYVIELAPRNGGNQIPELLQLATGTDLIAALVDAALDNPVHLPAQAPSALVANVMVHAISSGLFQRLVLSETITPYLLNQELTVQPGEPVRAFERATDALGTLTFHFPSAAEQQAVLSNITDLVSVVVDPA